MHAVTNSLESRIECSVSSFVKVLAQMSAVHCTAKKHLCTYNMYKFVTLFK